MVESEQVDTPTESMYSIAASLPFVDDGSNMSVRILNIDESEISTDGTTQVCGGRPVTEYSPTDGSLPNGANSTNKAGNASTFIGGSIINGPKKIEAAVARSHTREQQDLLAKANTVGSRFRATCGEPLNCDDFLSAKQRCHKVDN